MRMVVDLTDLDASRWVQLTGQSGHVFDPHYTDQVEALADGETYPWPFSAERARRRADTGPAAASSGATPGLAERWGVPAESGAGRPLLESAGRPSAAALAPSRMTPSTRRSWGSSGSGSASRSSS